MNAFSLGISNNEKESILSQHKQIYNGYKTLNPSPVANEQPLYVQDFANDKDGMTVNNKGEVMKYTNMGINESKEIDEFFYFDKDNEDKEEREKQFSNILSLLGNQDKDRDEFDGKPSKVIGVDSNINKERMEEGEMCEQCGLNESMCECGTNEETNKNITEETYDEFSAGIRSIADNIIKSQQFNDLISDTDPADFSDEFEFADNLISWSLKDYEDSPFYDELVEYIKDTYSEDFFDAYRVVMGDEFDDEEGDKSHLSHPFPGVIDIDYEEMDEDVDDGEVASEVEPAYQFQSHGPEDVYGTLKDYDSEHPHHDYDSMEDVAKYDPSSDLENMFPDLDFGRAFSDEPSDTFQHDSGDVDRMGDEGLGQDTENDMDLGGVGSGYDFESDGADQSVYMGEEDEIEEEVDDDLKESFKTQKTKILEMFNRFNKYN